MSMAGTAMPTIQPTTESPSEDADAPPRPGAAAGTRPLPPPSAAPAGPAPAPVSLAAPAQAPPGEAGHRQAPPRLTVPGLAPSGLAPASLAPPGQVTPGTVVPMSATLAANEILARKRAAGEHVLPMAFGEAGLPAHPALWTALSAATSTNAYGPVAGLPALRRAAAGYWSRRGLPTTADMVVSGPGSKSLLFGLLLAIGADVALPRPSWVTYAAQAAMIGSRPHFVPTPPGEGGVCDPAALERAVIDARAAGRRIGSVVVTLPDNPTGRLARPATVRALAEVAAEHDLIIISDEIYRDLVHDGTPPLAGPAEFAPGRTVVTTALSKSLALGGWRVGVTRLPEGETGRALRSRLVGIGSEIWSATAGPIQEAAALAFREPGELTERITRSRRLHAAVVHAVARVFADAGIGAPQPQAAFYLYPDFGPWRGILAARHGVRTGAGLASLLLDRYGMGVLPASVFGEDESALRVRVATGLLYGDTAAQREEALGSDDPLALPWVAASLTRVREVLADLAP